MVGGAGTTVGKLAGELGVTVEVVLDACRRSGVSAFGAASPLDAGESARVHQLLGGSPWAPPEAGGLPSPPVPTYPPAGPLLPPPAPVPPPRGERSIPIWAVIGLGVLTAGVVIGGGLVLTGGSDDDEPQLSQFEAVEDFLEEEPTTVPGPPAPGVLDDVLVVGDCWTDPATRSLVDTPEEPSSFVYEEMPCDQPHHAEVYAIASYPHGEGAPFPGDEALLDEGHALCAPHWEPYVGIPLDRSVFDSILLYPTERSWLIGDRQAICSLYPLDGSLLRTGARGVGR